MGYDISIPYGDNASYDFILDVKGFLLKIQSKTSRAMSDGESYQFTCEKMRINRRQNIKKRYQKGEVDFFCTFVRGRCYLIPFDECGGTKTLRFSAKNNNKNINFAEDYEAEKQIKIFLEKMNT